MKPRHLVLQVLPLALLSAALALSFSSCQSIKRELSTSRADPTLEQVYILEELQNRQVRLTDNAAKYAKPGEEMYVCAYAPNGVTLRTINDAQTGQPLKARILETFFFGSPLAVIQGAHPLGARLEGALLTRELPDDASRNRMADGEKSAPKNYPEPTG
ncbi:MAG TPA: hypothetical protein VG711_08890 [Phycisphaerales bacterium]|nr:hypothetical protein [Phycisphaerales bacterium]